MFYAIVSVGARAYFTARGVNDHGTYGWIRRRQTDAGSGQIQSLSHVTLVEMSLGRRFSHPSSLTSARLFLIQFRYGGSASAVGWMTQGSRAIGVGIFGFGFGLGKEDAFQLR